MLDLVSLRDLVEEAILEANFSNAMALLDDAGIVSGDVRKELADAILDAERVFRRVEARALEALLNGTLEESRCVVVLSGLPREQQDTLQRRIDGFQRGTTCCRWEDWDSAYAADRMRTVEFIPWAD